MLFLVHKRDCHIRYHSKQREYELAFKPFKNFNVGLFRPFFFEGGVNIEFQFHLPPLRLFHGPHLSGSVEARKSKRFYQEGKAIALSSDTGSKSLIRNGFPSSIWSLVASSLKRSHPSKPQYSFSPSEELIWMDGSYTINQRLRYLLFSHLLHTTVYVFWLYWPYAFTRSPNMLGI